MRGFLLLLLLLVAACRTRLPEPDPHEFYAGAGVSLEKVPGAVFIAGQRASAKSPLFDIYIEGHILRQWGDADLGQLEVGAKQVLSPGYKSHLYFRYGATWLRLVGDSPTIREAGDYFGGYVGTGYEWDLTPRISCGPELDLYALGGEGPLGFEFLPRVLFQLNVKF